MLVLCATSKTLGIKANGDGYDLGLDVIWDIPGGQL